MKHSDCQKLAFLVDYDLMKALNQAVKQRPVVYITRDLERALGAPLGLKNYFIVTNYTPFGKRVAQARGGITLIKNKRLLDTRELLQHPATKKLLATLKHPAILVFKNTPEIERLCASLGCRLLNPPAALSNLVEEKISQVDWLGPLAKFLPPHHILECQKISFSGTPFILQFNRAHTGSGTILIQSKRQLEKIKKQFPLRPARVTAYLTGPMFTNNNVVAKNKILIGNINYQITGLRPFTRRPFATIGNDWELPTKLLSKKQIAEYHRLAKQIGQRLAAAGWKGLFGIDVLLDRSSDRLYLIEINARQPASATYESQLQNRQQDTQRCSSFEAHLAALLGQECSADWITITQGAQVVQKRVIGMNKINAAKIKKLEALGCLVTPYTNQEPESDLLRVQSPAGIMAAENKFNAVGKKIIAILKTKK